MTSNRTTPPFPTKEAVLDFIQQSPGAVGKREIARAFNLRGEDKIPLKALLKELKSDGHFGREARQKKNNLDGRLPPVLVVEITRIDNDGELVAVPASWEEEHAPPSIYIIPERKSKFDLSVGDRILGKLKRLDNNSYQAIPIRKLETAALKILGIYQITEEGGFVRPVDKKAKSDFILNPEYAKEATHGELVLCEIRKGRSRKGLKEVQVVERLGGINNPRALSLVAIYERGIPNNFSSEAVEEARAAKAAVLGKRTDLRDIPLVTIDGADARDFDDAVWAEALDDGEGWRVLVAIADVAHYVHPGSPLDDEAQNRGNSTYFADRVVPMLPEELSNGWCSLNPDEDRPCMAVHLWLDSTGELVKHKFVRGLMRSRARLTYEQVQEALDGRPDNITQPLLPTVLKPLEGAYQALLKARHARGTLELDIPEFQVRMDDAGEVTEIIKRERLESHKLIEEFMIMANVAAAIELEQRRQPCMYRVHESPDPARIEGLADSLHGMGVSFAKGQVITPKVLTRVLERTKDLPEAKLVNELILRAQSQARYDPENLGHFGLALTRYAHFTSPIRRYSDLMVHRALIRGLGLGNDGLSDTEESRFNDIAVHISATERRSAAAERDTINRFTASFFSHKIGKIFPGKINGVTKAGLFITLDDTGADGLVPMRQLPDDYYIHNEKEHILTGRRWGREYHLGNKVMVRVTESDPVSGGIAFRLIEDGDDEGSVSGTADNRKRSPRSPRNKASGKPGFKKPGTSKKRSRNRRAD
ncbi:ribonuclease R [Kiloniella laminariae]|uniref:Ribonuclease R n=1 Tax=Kiloniella laminariae TaxID=454162 RepID=A0ABT4LHD3_9PROT|nr:ribonuclease R [Kiloniella laminariae]MCZ4280350.1 ribonuclease R [Kiloniella laminariae]